MGGKGAWSTGALSCLGETRHHSGPTIHHLDKIHGHNRAVFPLLLFLTTLFGYLTQIGDLQPCSIISAK